MLKKIPNAFISQLNQNPTLKKSLVQFIDFLFEFRKIAVGNLIRNPAYLQHILHSKVIAKPGTLSFKGGAFNPGALLLDNNYILLLAKAQRLPWYKARGKHKHFFLTGNPVTFLLNQEKLNTIKEQKTTHIKGFPSNDDWAIEDMRLFWWKNQIMINHSLIKTEIIGEHTDQTSVSSALSVFDEMEKVFNFVAVPILDFSLQNIEKNWVYTQSQDDLLLFYSLNPFRVLKLQNEHQFTFKTIVNHQFKNKLTDPGGFGTLVSFSTNPIDFDNNHWLVIIHQIQHKMSGRCYYHWAVLINKLTVTPEKISSKPIFSGMGARGRTPGIRYISSILKIDHEILFFAGEGDVYITVTKKSIKELTSLFINL